MFLLCSLCTWWSSLFLFQVSWTEALRTIVKNCYKNHGREDLLHIFNDEGTSTQQAQPQYAAAMNGTLLQTVNNPDGSVSIIQIDTTTPGSVVTLPDGTQATVVHAVSQHTEDLIVCLQHSSHSSQSWWNTGYKRQPLVLTLMTIWKDTTIYISSVNLSLYHLWCYLSSLVNNGLPCIDYFFFSKQIWLMRRWKIHCHHEIAMLLHVWSQFVHMYCSGRSSDFTLTLFPLQQVHSSQQQQQQETAQAVHTLADGSIAQGDQVHMNSLSLDMTDSQAQQSVALHGASLGQDHQLVLTGDTNLCATDSGQAVLSKCDESVEHLIL